MGTFFLYLLTLFLDFLSVMARGAFLLPLLLSPTISDFEKAIVWVILIGPEVASLLTFAGVPSGFLLSRWMLGARKPSDRERANIEATLKALTAGKRVRWPSHIYVIDSPVEQNAMVRGTTLYIYRELTTSDFLETVIAHELGHINSLDGRVILALERLTIPIIGHFFEKVVGVWKAIFNGTYALLDFYFGFDSLLRLIVVWPIKTCVRLLEAAITLVGHLAVGQYAVLMTGKLWIWHFREHREYAADAYAAELGQAGPLVEFLELHKFLDVSIPWNEGMTHPPKELRIDKLLKYQEGDWAGQRVKLAAESQAGPPWLEELREWVTLALTSIREFVASARTRVRRVKSSPSAAPTIPPPARSEPGPASTPLPARSPTRLFDKLQTRHNDQARPVPQEATEPEPPPLDFLFPGETGTPHNYVSDDQAEPIQPFHFTQEETDQEQTTPAPQPPLSASKNTAQDNVEPVPSTQGNLRGDELLSYLKGKLEWEKNKLTPAQQNTVGVWIQALAEEQGEARNRLARTIQASINLGTLGSQAEERRGFLTINRVGSRGLLVGGFLGIAALLVVYSVSVLSERPINLILLATSTPTITPEPLLGCSGPIARFKTPPREINGTLCDPKADYLATATIPATEIPPTETQVPPTLWTDEQRAEIAARAAAAGLTQNLINKLLELPSYQEASEALSEFEVSQAQETPEPTATIELPPLPTEPLPTEPPPATPTNAPPPTKAPDVGRVRGLRVTNQGIFAQVVQAKNNGWMQKIEMFSQEQLAGRTHETVDIGGERFSIGVYRLALAGGGVAYVLLPGNRDGVAEWREGELDTSQVVAAAGARNRGEITTDKYNEYQNSFWGTWQNGKVEFAK